MYVSTLTMIQAGAGAAKELLWGMAQAAKKGMAAPGAA